MIETAEVHLKQCGEVLPHHGFLSLPLIFPYIFSKLVHGDTAVSGECGLGLCEKFVGIFRYNAVRSAFFGGLNKQPFTLRQCGLPCMLLEHQQVCAYLDAASFHEDVIGKSQCRYEVGVVYKILPYELVAGSVGYSP